MRGVYRRKLSFVMVLVVLLAGVSPIHSFAGTSTLTPEADKSFDPYGGGLNGAELYVGSATGEFGLEWMKSAIRFDTSGITGSITSAILRVYISTVQNGSKLDLYGSNDVTFDETNGTAVSQDTSITIGSITISPSDLNTWKEIDVTSYVNSKYPGASKVSFVIEGDMNNGDRYFFIDSSQGTNPPQLVIETGNPGTLQFDPKTASVGESAGTTNLTVTRTGGSDGAVTVDYAVTGGTATGSGTDYTLASGTLNFATGETSKQISVSIADDGSYESDETVEVTLSNATGGASLGADKIATLTITDNDAVPGTLQFNPKTASVGEGAGTTNLTVTRTGGSDGAVTVDYAVTGGTATGSGTDYTLASGTLNFATGETSKTISVSITDDGTTESNETVEVTLSNATGGASLGADKVATLTITDNDAVAGTLQFNPKTASVGEGAGTTNLTVTRTGGSDGAITVDYAVTGGTATGAGTDYTLANGTLSFADGETGKTISISITDDGAYEASETVEVTLSNATGGASLGADKVATLTITDNDAVAGTLQFNPTTAGVSEGAGTANLTVTRTGGSDGAVTVDYAVTGGTATGSGSDYTLASGTLSFADSETSKTITVSIADDGTTESNETVEVTLSNATGGASLGADKVATLTITDDDPVPAATAIASAATLTPVVGADNAITLTVKNSLGNTDISFDGVKNVTLSGVVASPVGTFGTFNGTTIDNNATTVGQVVPVTFVNGVATANLKLNKAGAQTIGFSIETVTTPDTNKLTIASVPGVAETMAISQNITAPTSNGGLFAKQPIIVVKDAYGNTASGDNTTVVTVAKEDTGAWNLTGTATAVVNSGVATFTNLGATSSTLVDNVQLGFTATGLNKVTSAAVTLPAPVSSGGSQESPSESTSESTSQSNQEAATVIVNGREQDAGKKTKSTENGKSTVTIEVDNRFIERKINEAVENNTSGTPNTLQVLVPDETSEVAKVALPGDIVRKLEEETFVVSVKRHSVEYVIAAEEFTINKVAESMGIEATKLDEITVEVKISRVDEALVKKYTESAEANGAEVQFPPTSFEVIAKTTKTDGTTEEIRSTKFNNYVERVMEIPAGVDPSKITTGIVFNPDGTYSHIPTDVYQKDGKWYAKLNSLTNSVYSIIGNPIVIKSVENHWSEATVNDMASRLVIFEPESFNPDLAISRGDFAEYIVRALGLFRDSATVLNAFTDVDPTGERALAIHIANDYGIIKGYLDGNFRPDALITREEAMAMYQRAMTVTKLSGDDKNRYLIYKDFSEVNGWATAYVKEALAAHALDEIAATTVSPKKQLTHAEAAQMIKNLLVESNLINE
ncbi:Calx-beta domain-containing protein [Fusibacter sp. JL298sf-3]